MAHGEGGIRTCDRARSFLSLSRTPCVLQQLIKWALQCHRSTQTTDALLTISTTLGDICNVHYCVKRQLGPGAVVHTCYSSTRDQMWWYIHAIPALRTRCGGTHMLFQHSGPVVMVHTCYSSTQDQVWWYTHAIPALGTRCRGTHMLFQHSGGTGRRRAGLRPVWYRDGIF